MANDFPGATEPSMASLVGGIVNDVQTLIKQEMALAKREVTDELHKARDAALALGIGVGLTAVDLQLERQLLSEWGKRRHPGGSIFQPLEGWSRDPRAPGWRRTGVVAVELNLLDIEPQDFATEINPQ